MKSNWTRRWMVGSLVIALMLILVACGGDDKDDGGSDAADNSASATEESGAGPAVLSGAPEVPSGPSLTLNTGGGGLPGCNDPDDTECPLPLELDLDGEITADGVTLAYPMRYLAAVTGDEALEDVLIQITPNERYTFQEQATFQVYFAASVETALAELTAPLITEWSADHLPEGTIAVVKDRSVDPPVNTAIGAFPVPDDPAGRVIVLKLVTTGKYGWDLFSLTYEQMLDSLIVTAE